MLALSNCIWVRSCPKKAQTFLISADPGLRRELRAQAGVHRDHHGHGLVDAAADHASHPRNPRPAGENPLLSLHNIRGLGGLVVSAVGS